MSQDYNWPIKKFKVSSLRLDPANPRIPSGAGSNSQRDIIAELVRNDNVFSLAKSIAHNGFYPNEIPVTFVSKDDKKRYVAEGNRRVAAVKCLLTPEATPSEFKSKFQQLSNVANLKAIESLNVVTAPDRKATMPLLLDRHTHLQIEKWSRPMQAQFLQRLHSDGMTVEEIAAYSRSTVSDVRSMLRADALYKAACSIDFGPKLNDKVRSPRKFPLSTLERLFESKIVLDFFGLEKDDTKLLKGKIKKDEFIKGFSKVVRDVTDKKVNSRKLNNANAIREYLKSFKGEKPKKTTGRFSIRDLGGAAGKPPKSKPAKKPKAKAKAATSLVPTGTLCSCESSRIQDVFAELRKLNVKNYPNASAILLRTLLDLAVHNHLEKRGKINELVDKIQKKQKKGKDWAPSLRQMLNFMLENVDLGMRGQPLTALKTFTNDKLNPVCLDGLDKFTHNNYLPPDEKTLRNIWVTVSPLMEVILVDPA